MIEIWKDIPGYNPYQASNLGNIKGPKKILKPRLCSKYLSVFVFINGIKIHKRVHRLVGLAWRKNPKNLPQLNHKDGNRLNNRPDNLEWSTPLHNIEHAIGMGLIKPRIKRAPKGDNHPNRKLVWADILKIRDRFTRGWTKRELSEAYDVSYQQIRNIINFSCWTSPV